MYRTDHENKRIVIDRMKIPVNQENTVFSFLWLVAEYGRQKEQIKDLSVELSKTKATVNVLKDKLKTFQKCPLADIEKSLSA